MFAHNPQHKSRARETNIRLGHLPKNIKNVIFSPKNPTHFKKKKKTGGLTLLKRPRARNIHSIWYIRMVVEQEGG